MARSHGESVGVAQYIVARLYFYEPGAPTYGQLLAGGFAGASPPADYGNPLGAAAMLLANLLALGVMAHVLRGRQLGTRGLVLAAAAVVLWYGLAEGEYRFGLLAFVLFVLVNAEIRGRGATPSRAVLRARVARWTIIGVMAFSFVPAATSPIEEWLEWGPMDEAFVPAYLSHVSFSLLEVERETGSSRRAVEMPETGSWHTWDPDAPATPIRLLPGVLLMLVGIGLMFGRVWSMWLGLASCVAGWSVIGGPLFFAAVRDERGGTLQEGFWGMGFFVLVAVTLAAILIPRYIAPGLRTTGDAPKPFPEGSFAASQHSLGLAAALSGRTAVLTPSVLGRMVLVAMVGCGLAIVAVGPIETLIEEGPRNESGWHEYVTRTSYSLLEIEQTVHHAPGVSEPTDTWRTWDPDAPPLPRGFVPGTAFVVLGLGLLLGRPWMMGAGLVSALVGWIVVGGPALLSGEFRADSQLETAFWRMGWLLLAAAGAGAVLITGIIRQAPRRPPGERQW